MLYIIGQIDDESYEKFSRQLGPLETNSTLVHVELSSEGGLSYSGLAFYGRIRTSSAQIHVRAHGLVHSAATLVYVAGDHRTCSRECSFMFHDTTERYKGQAVGAAQWAERLEREEQQWAHLLAARTGTPEDTWRKLSKKTTFLTAPQAYQLGLVHEILKEKK